MNYSIFSFSIFGFRLWPDIIVFSTGWIIFMLVYAWTTAIVAWIQGIGVETISLGFGPRLLGIKFPGWEFRLSLIPFGSYVQFRSGDPAASNEFDNSVDEFLAHPPVKRLLVAAAGPVSSLLLGGIVLAASWWIGRDEPRFVQEPVKIGWVRPSSKLHQMGLMHGDEVFAAVYGGENTRIGSWRDLLQLLTTKSPGYRLKLEGKRGDAPFSIETLLEKSALFDLCHEIPPVVGALRNGSPAEGAGFQPGDRVVEIDGKPIEHWLEMDLALSSHAVNKPSRKEIIARVQRPNGRMLSLKIDGAQLNENIEQFGLKPTALLAEKIQKSVWDGLTTAGFELLHTTWIFKRAFFKQGEYSFEYTGLIAQDNGYRRLLAYSFAADGARLLIALGITGLVLFLFNMLPIGVLNGGVILMIGFEFLLGRVGMTLTMNARERYQQIGFLIVLCLMPWVIYVLFW